MAKVHYNDKDKEEGYCCVCEELFKTKFVKTSYLNL